MQLANKDEALTLATSEFECYDCYVGFPGRLFKDSGLSFERFTSTLCTLTLGGFSGQTFNDSEFTTPPINYLCKIIYHGCNCGLDWIGSDFDQPFFEQFYDLAGALLIVAIADVPLFVGVTLMEDDTDDSKSDDKGQFRM
ncbi:hypothetical protein ACFE04_020945 [Oxalis oulophora]